MIRKLRDVIIGQLRPVLAQSVFKSHSAAHPPNQLAFSKQHDRYAVVHLNITGRRAARFSSRANSDTYMVTVHCIGIDEDSALWVLEKTDLRLSGLIPTVPGLGVTPLQFVDSTAPELDLNADRPLWLATISFSFTTYPQTNTI